MPDVGISSRYGLNNDASFSVGLDVGIGSVAFESQFVQTNKRTHEQYSYLSLFPSLYYGGFVLGVNYDIPMGSKGGTCYDVDTDNEVSMLTNGGTNYRDFLASVPSLKTGARIQLMKNEGGSMLNLDILASYALTGLFSDGATYIGSYDYNGSVLKFNSAKNATPASISIGFSYLLPIRL